LTLARHVKKFITRIFTDIGAQYAIPRKSISGAVMTRLWSRQSNFLEREAVKHLGIRPDEYVLEIGYGRGDGLDYAYRMIKGGHGVVFAIDRSPYMQEVAAKRFTVEIVDEDRIQLDKVLMMDNLPYPSNFFNGIFHVNCFYFWPTNLIRNVVWEMARILCPGGRLVCTMEIDRLNRMADWGIIERWQFDPMRYLPELERAGLVDVKMEYIRTEEEGIEYQLIMARKPVMERSLNVDAEHILSDLEEEIKWTMLKEKMLREDRPIVDTTTKWSDTKKETKKKDGKGS